MTDIPKDFTDALKAGGVAQFFSGCTGPHQREYLNWIVGAKRPETRLRRIAQAMKMLSARQAKEAACAKKKAKANSQ